MKTVSRVLSETKSLQGGSRTAGGDPVARRESDTDVKRVSNKQLETVYENVPVANNAVNKTTQLIMRKGRELTGPNADFYQEFLDNVGNVGGNMHWNEILESIFRYQMIYGEAYVELVRDKNSGNIVDLALVDPKEVEYATEGRTDKIATDKFGNPVGYIQRIPDWYTGLEQVYEPPEGISVQANELYIPAENMMHFKLNTVGEGFRPIGFLEPAYRDAERAHQLKKDYGDKAHSTLYPTRIAKVGDEQHEPTPQKIKEIRDILVNAKSSTEISVPHYVDVDMLETEQPEALISFFDHFNSEIITAIGIPEAFATGEGGDVNRATLAAQSRMFEVTINSIVKNTSETIRSQMFERMAEQEGFEDIPDYNWDETPEIATEAFA